MAEQLVDDPVRSGGFLLGSLPQQDLTALVAEQLVPNPVRGGGLRGFLPVQGSTAFGGAEHLAPGGSVHGSRPDQGSTAFGGSEHLVLGGSLHGTAFFGAQHVHHQDFSPGQSSTEVRRDGRLVPGQSSTALGGADDVEDLIGRSQELLEHTRREYSFSSEEEGVEEEEEEETEQMDIVVDVPAVQVVVWVSWKVPQIQFIARVCGPSSLQRDGGLSARVWRRCRVGHFSRSSLLSRS